MYHVNHIRVWSPRCSYSPHSHHHGNVFICQEQAAAAAIYIIGFSNIVVCYYIHNSYTLLCIFIYILHLIVLDSYLLV